MLDRTAIRKNSSSQDAADNESAEKHKTHALEDVEQARSRARESLASARKALDASKSAISEGVTATQERTVRRAQELGHQVAAKAGDVKRTLIDAEHRAEDAVSRLGVKAKEQYDEVAEFGSQSISRARIKVRHRPLTSVFAGLGAGLLTGWTLNALRRRRSEEARREEDDR